MRGRVVFYFVVIDSAGKQSELTTQPVPIEIDAKKFEALARKDFVYDVKLIMIPGRPEALDRGSRRRHESPRAISRGPSSSRPSPARRALPESETRGRSETVNAPVSRLVLFAREPVPGRVKTRLAREIGRGRRGVAVRGVPVGPRRLADVAGPVGRRARHAEFEPGPYLLATFRPPWDLVPQGEGTLGERLARAVVRARHGRAARRARGGQRRADAHGRGSLRGLSAPSPERRDVVYRAGAGRRVLARRHARKRRSGRRLPGRSEMVVAARARRQQEVRRGEGLPRAPALDAARHRRDHGTSEGVEALFAADPDLAPATRRALLGCSGGAPF